MKAKCESHICAVCPSMFSGAWTQTGLVGVAQTNPAAFVLGKFSRCFQAQPKLHSVNQSNTHTLRSGFEKCSGWLFFRLSFMIVMIIFHYTRSWAAVRRLCVTLWWNTSDLFLLRNLICFLFINCVWLWGNKVARKSCEVKVGFRSTLNGAAWRNGGDRCEDICEPTHN